MTPPIILATLFLLPQAANQATAAQVGVDQPAVRINFWIVQFDRSLPDNELPFNARALAPELAAHGMQRDDRGRVDTRGLAVQEALDKFEVTHDEHRLHFAAGRLEGTRGDAKRDTAADTDQPPAPWKIIAAPALVVFVDQEASLSVGQSITFMVQRDDGSFIPATRDEYFEGIKLSLRAVGPRDDGLRFEQIRVRVSRLVGRQRIDGVSLDIGEPIIDTRETELNITLQPDRVGIIPLPQGDDEDPVFVLMTAAMAKEPR